MDMNGLSWVDWALLAVLLMSVLIGVVRGLVFEVLSLLGWLVAYVGAQMFAGEVAELLPLGTPGSALNLAAAFALTFIGILLGWSLLARLARMLIHATPLTLLDRAAGAAFGLLRGGLVLLVLATGLNMTALASSPAWKASLGAQWLDAALKALRPWLPDAVARHLPAQARLARCFTLKG